MTVGSRVRYTPLPGGYPHLGEKTGTVREITDDGWVIVKFDYNRPNKPLACDPGELEVFHAVT